MAEVSTARVLNELKISRSTLSFLIKAHGIQVPISETGRYQWDDDSFSAIKNITAEKQDIAATLVEEKKHKTTLINNRRYLGNKYKLLEFIKSIVSSECKSINTVADVFAGTGAVASAFLDKKVIANDTLYSNYICHVAWFSSQKYDYDKVFSIIERYNNLTITENNYVSENFGNTYFSLDDCSKIGFIREDIETRHNSGDINLRERAILLT